MRKNIVYSDSFQKKYRYTVTEPAGKHFHPEFRPDLTPKEMLRAGVFGGAYFIAVEGLIPSDLPKNWFRGVQLSDTGKKQKQLNFFKQSASQSRTVWVEKGWIHPDDPHGWFQWYCRYYLGRRHSDDMRQIKRWKAFRRHLTAVQKYCKKGDMACRPRQRQALLHWGYDGRGI